MLWASGAPEKALVTAIAGQQRVELTWHGHGRPRRHRAHAHAPGRAGRRRRVCAGRRGLRARPTAAGRWPRWASCTSQQYA
ncbi:MAG: hypothetical protein WKG07_09485, partial [Hymenobacter sp.]